MSMQRLLSITAGLLLMTASVFAAPPPGNRLAYLNEACNPYYVHRDFPKLITPQWVGEEGVEAVVILAIDDMRGHEKWEAYLRPILERLKKIDGRAPVSIMTCSIDPQHPHLQQWLNEGLSLEIHTVDHPCPLLQGGDLAKAKSTYDRCVDLLNQVPGNKPVAFRMPCCDSLNTLSPRFFTEIFNKTTEKGNYLQLDSSVFNVFTADDPSLPKELVLDADGTDKFKKYLPSDRTFVNTIENYPYPYIIDHRCWEFPCATPSDWAAQHKHKPDNPITVNDWKAAIDCTVIKQGVFNLVFHPHNWIKPEQVIEMIDHAVAKHGKKVKFLTFKEASERLNKTVLNGTTLRKSDGSPAGNYLVDLNQDGYLDFIYSDNQSAYAREWQPTTHEWVSYKKKFEIPQPPALLAGTDLALRHRVEATRYVDLNDDGQPDKVFSDHERYSIHLWDQAKSDWSREVVNTKRGSKPADQELPPIIRADGTNNGFWVHSKMLVWQNEDTAKMKDLIDRRAFADLLRDVDPGPKNAADGLKSIHMRPGFTVEQMAAEPLTMDPVAFEWGADGKLWVVEMADYPKGIDGNWKPGGRVRYVEDTDADGKYDKSTLFLDGIPYPTGVMPWKKGVLVSTAPDVFYAEDTDGDGKADQREVLYTGFAEGNQQHRVNGLVWGLDNWIYLANGDSGGSVKSVKTGKVVAIGGRDVRIQPETGDIDTVTGQTQFGRNRDDWGNWFGCNNSNPMYQFVLEDRYLRRSQHFAGINPVVHTSVNPGASPVFPRSVTRARFNDLHTANRFTSACSAMVYRDNLFGPQYENSCFISEPVHNLVHREVLSSNGVVFTSQRADDEQQSEFLASDDNWFRPTMTKTAPDGALWIADMYRHVIEHPEWIPPDWQKRLDLRAGHDKGRLYRVYPTTAKPRAILRLDKLSTAELVDALRSPSGWQRDTVQRLLVERQSADAIPLLTKLAREAPEPLARLHALCTLEGLKALTSDTVGSGLHDTHPGVRRQAVRLTEELKSRSPELLAALFNLKSDPDAAVRLQLACTLGEIDVPEAGQVIGELAQSTKGDRFLFAAAMSSLNKKNLPGALASVVNRPDGREPNVNFLEQLLAVASAFGDDVAVQKLLEQATTPTGAKLADWQFRAVATLSQALDRRQKSLATLVAGKDPNAQLLLHQLQALLATAAIRAEDAALPEAERVVSIHLLGRDSSQSDRDLAALTTLNMPSSPPAIRAAAVEALEQSGHDVAVGLIVSPWKTYSPSLRNQVLDLMLNRKLGATQLLSALEENLIEPQAFDAARRQRLLDQLDGKQRPRAEKVLAFVSTTRQQVLQTYQSALQLAGDAVHGQALFSKTCAQCHKLAGAGHEVGPDLTALTDKSPEAMLVAMLDPNRAVEQKFLNFTAVTKAGRSFSGMLASESGNSITLRAAEGKEETILREDLDELIGTSKSTMPEGLEKDLKPQDVADLIAFVRANVSLPKRKEFFGNDPKPISDGNKGWFDLTSKTCEIYGPTVVLETQYGNLGYWSSDDDHAVWTLNVRQSGKYRVTFDYACDNGAAGQLWRLDGGAQALTGKVAGTGTWDDYRQTEVGDVVLEQGQRRLTLRPAEHLRGAMIDLKGIRLTRRTP